MRRKDREVTDIADILGIINECKVLRIALRDDAGLYIVPVNFGYSYYDSELTFYFHSAKEGRKISAISVAPEVCFEMDCGHGLIESDRACGFGYLYQSVIGNGIASIVADTQEKIKALTLILKHQTGRDFVIDREMADSAAIVKLTAASFTAKRHL